MAHLFFKTGTAILIGILILLIPVQAMVNPSAVYCSALGYEYHSSTNPDGSMTGYCKLPDNRYVNAWDFLRGEVAQGFNYCGRMSYLSKVTTDPEKCDAITDSTCNVCVLPDKSEVEVTTLMQLSFDETTCGDGRCVVTEDALNCPLDCPSSGRDGLCQNHFDFKCDKDCTGGKGDLDCVYLSNPAFTILIIVGIILIVLGIFFWKRKKKSLK